MLDIYCHKNSGSCPVMGESNRSLALDFGSFHWISVTEYLTKLPRNWQKETNVFLCTCSCFLWIATFPAAEKAQGTHKPPAPIHGGSTLSKYSLARRPLVDLPADCTGTPAIVTPAGLFSEAQEARVTISNSNSAKQTWVELFL